MSLETPSLSSMEQVDTNKRLVQLMTAKLCASVLKAGEWGEIQDTPATTPDPKALYLTSTSPRDQIKQWTPTLILPIPKSDHAPPQRTHHKLYIREVVCNRIGTNMFRLESSYEMQGSLPRSYFSILQQHHIGHCFVFMWPRPDHVFFQELAGLRKTAYINVIEEHSQKTWELHLKPSKERTNLFAYLCDPVEIRNIINERTASLLLSRRLPLVLDLDDTLVRIVGMNPQRYVPEEVLPLVPHRVRDLKDGRKVVLAENVIEFIEWAQNYFEISICSLGDQPYVDMVVQVLDPAKPNAKPNIRGISYSARGEYMYIQQSGYPKRPPKDLISLFPWCAVSDASMAVDPIIVDDNVNMWPMDQQDHIINVLQAVHFEFFRAFDAWNAESERHRHPFPSPVTCYKEILRRDLSFRIAESGL